MPLLGESHLSLQDPENPPAEPKDASKDYGATDEAKKKTKTKSKAPGGIKETIEVPKGKADDASTITNDGRNSVISQIIEKPHVPSQNPCLWLFHLLEGIATLTSALLMFSQLIPLFMPSGKVTHPDVLAAILKLYVSLICFAFIVVEADLPVPFVRDSSLLQTFGSRGFIYSFVGLVTTTEAYSQRVDDLITHSSDKFYIGWVPIFMQVVAWMMFGIGAAYMMLGICCLRGMRDRMKQQERDMWKQYREDMRKWRRQRNE